MMRFLCIYFNEYVFCVFPGVFFLMEILLFKGSEVKIEMKRKKTSVLDV